MTSVSLVKESRATVVVEEDAKPGPGPVYVARAELVLAGPTHRPLSRVGARQDPLQLVAAAMSHVRWELGEDAEVVVDLIPVPAQRVKRMRRRLLARARRRGPSAFGERLPAAGGSGAGGWASMAAGQGGGARTARQTDLAEGVGKFVPGAEVFEVQVLVRTVATHPAQARARLHQILASLASGRGENWWRPVGPRRGFWRPYSNAWWRRRGFERRWSGGEFAPARRRQWVTVEEIAPWLHPPTVHCKASNVLRTGGVVAPAPNELPTWTGQPGMVPLGAVAGADGRRRLAAVPKNDVLFEANFGRSGNGKSELASVQAVALAHDGDGVWFLDPHGTAVARMRPYLAHPDINKRLWDIDLAEPRPETMMGSLNLLDMEHRSLHDLDVVVGSVAGAIAAAEGWGGSAPRAQTITSHAVQALAYLAHHMCKAGRPDLQPTIFQITPLVTDEQWRQAVIDVLPPKMARWWKTTFVDFPSDATTTVTRVLDDLELSPGAQAFLGSPQSTYSAREAMDTRRVVLLRPPGAKSRVGKILTSMLMFDLFLAGLSREGMPAEAMHTLWAFADELTAIDGAGGDTIALILEQLRKYEIRLMAATQMAMRLTGPTRAALMQNQTLLLSAGADTDEASFLAKRLPGLDPQTLVMLPKFQYVATTMLHGNRTDPFRVWGVPLEKVYSRQYNPSGVEKQQRAVDRTMRRRPVGEILTDLDTLDQRIYDHLTHASSDAPPEPAGQGLVHELHDHDSKVTR